MSDALDRPRIRPARGDLSVTALYTSAAWSWGGLPGASLLVCEEARRVFGVVNIALAIARFLGSKAPPLAAGLLHRHAIIDHLLASSGSRDVLELAAGLSRRGVSATADPGVRYVEVDLPRMVATKRALLERSEEGRAALARSNWRIAPGDLASPREVLAEVAPGPGPLFVIAEGLVMYLAGEARRALFSAIAARLQQGAGRFAFDLVPAGEQPAPGLVGRVLGWLMKRFTRGATFTLDARTREQVVAELREAGFARVELFEPAAVAAAFHLPMPEVRTQQLVFQAQAENVP